MKKHLTFLLLILSALCCFADGGPTPQVIVGTNGITDASVTTAKIADDAVTALKLNVSGIDGTTGTIAAGAVGTSTIESGYNLLTDQEKSDALNGSMTIDLFSQKFYQNNGSGNYRYCQRLPVRLAVASGTATTVFTITTTDAAAANLDGGVLTFNFNGAVCNGFEINSSTSAIKNYSFCGRLAKISTGNLPKYAVDETYESTSVTANSSNKDIGDVSVSINALSAYSFEVQITVPCAGSSAASPYIFGVLEVSAVSWYTTADPAITLAE